MTALAITDHGTMHGVVEFFKACKKEGVKPIIGCEFFLALRSLHDKEAGIDNKRYHLVLLAKNKKGYENLVQLVSVAHLEGLYYKPRIDWELLKKHSEGLIALSACLAGEVARAVLEKNKEEATEVAKKYREIFGEDFYLEIQNHPNIPEQGEVNKIIVEIATELNIPLVATNDVHYTNADDADAHDTLICIQTNAQKDSLDRMSMMSGNFCLLSGEEMAALFPDQPEACENTLKISEKCDFEFEFGRDLLPQFDTENGETDAEYLRQRCAEGIRERFGFDVQNPQNEQQKEIFERLELELSVINKMGYASYFLIVWDFVRWAREQGIAVGPGRGSAAGSLVSYVLKITDIDPLEHELFFERFLNPERISMPDIDLDFADDRRDEVIDYVRNKYGSERVAQICTFGTMAARAAIKDVGRVYGIPFGEMNDFVKMIPERPGTTLDEALETSKELRDDLKSNSTHKEIFATAKKLEGCVRHVSVHACAVVISPDPLQNYVPLQYPPKDDKTVITQFSQKPIDMLGLLKMDFLGLKNLTILEKAKKIIQRTHKVAIDFATVPMDDKKTFELLARGDTTGVFQLESAGMKRYLKELKPTNFEDIIAMVSLFRPGPMEWIPDYIAGKHGKKKITYVDESVKPILEKTFGIAIYQEQILKIAQVLAGFSLGEADILRRAIGKKIPEELQAQRKKFIDGAVAKGHSEEMAIKVFEKVVEPFAGYGFNRSHAASYAMIAYRTAYLKANYSTEFMAALLSVDAGNTDKVCRDIEECEKMGIKILPPSVNISLKNFTVAGESVIRFGLSAIKGIGDPVVDAILEARGEKKFESLEDFVLRLPEKIVNKKSLESLAKAGALSEFADPKVIIENTELISKFARSHGTKEQNPAQGGLFGDLTEETVAKLKLEDVPAATRLERLAWEVEILGLYVSDHPLKNLESFFAHKGVLIEQFSAKKRPQNPITVGGILANLRKITTKTKTTMAVLTLEDPTGKIEVVLFPKSYEKHLAVLDQGGEIFVVKGKWEERNGFLQVIADDLKTLSFEEVRQKAEKLPAYVRLEATEKVEFGEEEGAEVEVVSPAPVPVSINGEDEEVVGDYLAVDAVGDEPATCSPDECPAISEAYFAEQIGGEPAAETVLRVCEDLSSEERVLDDEPWRVHIPEGISRERLQKIKEIILKYRGDSAVEMVMDSKKFILPCRVRVCDELEQEIYAVLVGGM